MCVFHRQTASFTAIILVCTEECTMPNGELFAAFSDNEEHFRKVVIELRWMITKKMTSSSYHTIGEHQTILHFFHLCDIILRKMWFLSGGNHHDCLGDIHDSKDVWRHCIFQEERNECEPKRNVPERFKSIRINLHINLTDTLYWFKKIHNSMSSDSLWFPKTRRDTQLQIVTFVNTPKATGISFPSKSFSSI